MNEPAQSELEAREEHKDLGFLKRYEGELLFGFLMIYVLLLALGTIGVLFNVEWILNLPFF